MSTDIAVSQPPTREHRALSTMEEEEKKEDVVLYSSVLSLGEDESADESCSDDYVSDSFCSDDLESDGSPGEEPDAYESDEEEKDQAEEPTWDDDPEKEWEIWQIDAVELDADGTVTKVSVLWDWCPTPQSARFRRWELAAPLMKTHGELIQLALRFKKSGMRHFHAFCKQDDYGKRIITASDDYSCLFNGLEIGAKIIGRPDLIPEDVVDKLLDDELKQGRDLRESCTWQ